MELEENWMKAGALREGVLEEAMGGVENDQVGVGESLVGGGGATNEEAMMGATGIGEASLTARRGSGSRSPVIGPA